MIDETRDTLAGRSVGFIGLGLMGRPMAVNLHAAGATLVIPRRAAASMADLGSDRVEILETPAAIARAADIVILMLASADAMVEVCLGTDGLADAATPNTLVMDMGTTDAATTASIAARLQEVGAAFVDAPVSGGRVGATKGRLTIFVGADSAKDHERVAPLLEVMGENVTVMGKVGTGQAAKVVNQLISFSAQVTVAEAMALARRSGLELDTLIPALAGGAADSVVLQILGPRMAAEDWSITAHMSLAEKDLGIVIDAAEAHGLDLKVAAAARERWADAIRSIGPDHDIAEIVRLVDPDFSGGGWHGGGDAVGSGTAE
ncbi:MAG TPA: 2-hydroxy-3-oxopropionate reductase [Phycisphaerales bacterium]|nr:2-hydroxy-3-oxopropionate reductase [Phycisphaerales bacterium]